MSTIRLNAPSGAGYFLTGAKDKGDIANVS